MAENKFKTSPDHGSEEIPSIACEPCEELDGNCIQAAGYCVNCDEYLCVGCLAQHCRPKTMRNHVLKDKNDMPKSKTNVLPHISVSEKCNLHSDEDIVYFCTKHGQLCCKLCRLIKHPHCDTETIVELSKELNAPQTVKEITSKLKHLETEFTKRLQCVDENVSIAETLHSSTMDEIEKLHATFNKLKDTAVKEATLVKDDTLNGLKNTRETCTVLRNEVEKLSYHAQLNTQPNQHERTFIFLNRTERHIQELEGSLKSLEDDNAIQEYTFQANEELERSLRSLSALGRLRYKNTQKDKEPVYLQDIDVKTSSDQTTCYISGITVLENGMLVITDGNNKKVKLVDTNDQKVKSDLLLPHQVWDVTNISNETIALTYYDVNKIQFVSVSKSYSLAAESTISTNGKCRGIGYNHANQTLIVSFERPAKVEIIEMNGVCINSIERDNKGEQLFGRSIFVEFCNHTNTIYIPDNSKNTLTIMRPDGERLHVIDSLKTMLQNTTGVLVHKEMAYVAGHGSNDVYRIEIKDGSFKQILNQTDGLKSPLSISYCPKRDYMYIGMASDVIKVFHMK